MNTAATALHSQDLLRILAAMREGLQVVDREWRYVFLNEAAALHGRRTREELLGRTMMECYPGIDETPVFALMRRCLESGVPAFLVNEFTYPDGEKRAFELRIEACDLGVMVLSIDVTEGRRLEEQLRHAQRMDAIGRLAGSVAHDFNNLLSVILSYSTMTLEDLRPTDPLRGDIEAIKLAGERAAELTQQLLAFSRRQILAPKVVDLNEILQVSERMLARLLGENIELSARLARNLSRINVDPGQIDQVLMNLVVNARDAMPTGGKLSIETRDILFDEAAAASHFGMKKGLHVQLSVSDTGIGMDEATKSRIFEPFFTTKDSGKGTGLGLSTVFGIVQQSGGSIWVDSEIGKGTRFRIYFPAVSEAAFAARESPIPERLDGNETILLVEDQAEVRRVSCEILRRLGYRVLEAANPGEAVLECERYPGAIDLLLTDVVMPRMNGRELAERLVKLRPSMAVLFMSGYTEDAIVHHGILDSGIAYLQKPIVPAALARRVREVLDAAVATLEA